MPEDIYQKLAKHLTGVEFQMEAVELVDEKAFVDMDRCIGCGLRVSTCPADSMTLVRKPESINPMYPGT